MTNWFTPPVVFSDGQILTASQLNTTINAIAAGTVGVPNGGTGLTAGTSGGVPFFSSTSTIGTSALLTASALIVGGGAAGAPSSLALGTANQIVGMTNAATAHEYKTVTAGPGVTVAHSANAITIAAPPLRSYLAGLTLSNDGGSPNTVLDIAAGSATDGTNATLLTIAAFTKTTAAFVAGTGNGGLDTGAVAANTWYHVWLISTALGALTDILFSLSATAPTMPATYTLKRRIGAFKTASASTNILTFIQDGDYFRWLASILDINVTAPTTAAVSRTLTVPTGVNVYAIVNALWRDTAPTVVGMYLSDLAATDEAVSTTAAPLASGWSAANGDPFAGMFTIRTNTSAQIRSRSDTSAATTALRIATLGWIDRRGRDS